MPGLVQRPLRVLAHVMAGIYFGTMTLSPGGSFGFADARPANQISQSLRLRRSFSEREPLTYTQRALKRSLDICVGLALILLLLPLLAAVAAAIKISDPQVPVIFRQRRGGYGGRHS
jgi:lipopolysaccharide/colanic/teichoic acid biosynthesis glycosyltransferase